MIERDQQLLLPVRPSYIVGTLLAALMLNLLPFGRAPWAPDFLLVTMALWCLYQPARVGVGVAFCLGLVMDVHATTLLGIHALAYSVMASTVLLLHRRLQWFHPFTQALQMAAVFVAVHALTWVLSMASGGQFPGWELLGAPVAETLLWLPVSMILLAPQRRAPDRDLTRPL